MLWTLSGKLFAVEMILVSFFDDYIYLWGNRIVHNDEYDIDDNWNWYPHHPIIDPPLGDIVV